MISDEILVVKRDSLSNVVFVLIADLEGSLSSGVLLCFNKIFGKTLSLVACLET